jgi:hypothetical protein
MLKRRADQSAHKLRTFLSPDPKPAPDDEQDLPVTPIRKRLFPKSPFRGDQQDLLYREKVRTESLGKTFEMAICKASNIPYCGSYKYHSPPEKLVNKLKAFQSTLKPDLKHTAAGGSRYDFSSDSGFHISAKTSKQAVGRVAPQVIGQPSVSKFREVMSIPEDEDIRVYIYEHIESMMNRLMSYTFDSRILYYNEKKGEILRINQIQPIDWDMVTLRWSRTPQEWQNSNTLKANGKAILEVQIHSKSRSNLAIRWYIENLLDLFPHSFDRKKEVLTP